MNNRKIIIVTGGNGIIGKAIVSNLRKFGYVCINADITNKNNISKNLINLDLSNKESIDFLLEIVIKKYGKIDGLVNAAYPRTDDWSNKFEKINLESWRRNVDLQLNSLFYISQKTLIVMRKQKCGSIVNIASIYGIVAPDFSIYKQTQMTMPAAYSAIKGAIINFTKYLASNYGEYNVRINCVSPGGVFSGENPIFVKNYIKKVPLKRMANPNDIAPAIEFLVSDKSTYITGHNLVIDGGFTII